MKPFASTTDEKLQNKEHRQTLQVLFNNMFSSAANSNAQQHFYAIFSEVPMC